MQILVCMRQSVLNCPCLNIYEEFGGDFYISLTLENANGSYAAQNETQSFHSQMWGWWDFWAGFVVVFFFNFFNRNNLNTDLNTGIRKICSSLSFSMMPRLQLSQSYMMKNFVYFFCCVITLAWKVCVRLWVYAYIKCRNFVKIVFMLFWLRNCQVCFNRLSKCLQNY